MAISYWKLVKILRDRHIQFKQLEKDTGISHTTLSKINKDEYISLETLDIIANYLQVDVSKLISSE